VNKIVRKLPKGSGAKGSESELYYPVLGISQPQNGRNLWIASKNKRIKELGRG